MPQLLNKLDISGGQRHRPIDQFCEVPYHLMESQIKEEAKEASLCFESSGDNLASLSLIEKYDRFIQNENSEIDSDGEFFPDDTVLREEYAQLTSEATNYPRGKNHRLSSGLPGKFRKPDSDDDLIEKLAEVRKREPDGNSIFCTEEELNKIQERYGAILDQLYEKSSLFERKSSLKDSENDEQVDVGNATLQEQGEDMKRLAEKMVSVQQARDRFYEVERQVREQVEQLELVERYKMESLG